MIVKYKKALFLLLFIYSSIFASPLDIEKQICKRIVHGAFQEKTSIKVWSDVKKCHNILTDSSIIFVKTPQEADILVVSHEENILANKPIFVRKYYLLKKYKERAIGGFYWQKGRPNIIFIKKNLKKFSISIPDEFKKYIEDSYEY